MGYFVGQIQKSYRQILLLLNWHITFARVELWTRLCESHSWLAYCYAPVIFLFLKQNPTLGMGHCLIGCFLHVEISIEQFTCWNNMCTLQWIFHQPVIIEPCISFIQNLTVSSKYVYICILSLKKGFLWVLVSTVTCSLLQVENNEVFSKLPLNLQQIQVLPVQKATSFWSPTFMTLFCEVLDFVMKFLLWDSLHTVYSRSYAHFWTARISLFASNVIFKSCIIQC